MTRKQQRIFAAIMVLAGLGISIGLSLYALRDNVTFFYSPSDILGPDKKDIRLDRPFRLGGLVKQGSVFKEGTSMRFIVTDLKYDITVYYQGIAPDLFREGQGVVATGKILPSQDDEVVFEATNLLAKHDEKYMPPEVAKALKDAGHPDKNGDEGPNDGKGKSEAQSK